MPCPASNRAVRTPSRSRRPQRGRTLTQRVHQPCVPRNSPAQQSAVVAASSPSCAHVERHVFPRGPAQYCDELQHRYVVEHTLPVGAHIGGAPHVPPLHVSPEQHALEFAQLCPVWPHTGTLAHVPPEQVRPEQHALEAEQAWPLARHTGGAAHTPALHESPEQHALNAEHV